MDARGIFLPRPPGRRPLPWTRGGARPGPWEGPAVRWPREKDPTRVHGEEGGGDALGRRVRATRRGEETDSPLRVERLTPWGWGVWRAGAGRGQAEARE